MKSLVINIKNLTPYLFLIVIYFLFINLEARKVKENIDSIDNKIDTSSNISNKKDNNLRISIPVIPYNP